MLPELWFPDVKEWDPSENLTPARDPTMPSSELSPGRVAWAAMGPIFGCPPTSLHGEGTSPRGVAWAAMGPTFGCPPLSLTLSSLAERGPKDPRTQREGKEVNIPFAHASGLKSTATSSVEGKTYELHDGNIITVCADVFTAQKFSFSQALSV